MINLIELDRWGPFGWRMIEISRRLPAFGIAKSAIFADNLRKILF